MRYTNELTKLEESRARDIVNLWWEDYPGIGKRMGEGGCDSRGPGVGDRSEVQQPTDVHPEV
jgi:hypothetical protein